MQMCPYCNMVYDESEDVRCPYCSPSDEFFLDEEICADDFDDEDEYLRALKLEDMYYINFNIVYVSNRYGDGDNDVELDTFQAEVIVRWDDSETPGYVAAYNDISLPNGENIDSAEVREVYSRLVADALGEEGVRLEVFKDIY